MTIYCSKLQTLPRGLGKLGALKQLLLDRLDELQEMPDPIGLTALGSLTIKGLTIKGKLKTLPKELGKLGALTQLTLQGLPELQEMPDPIGLTALGNLTIEDCSKLRALPRGMGELGALMELTGCMSWRRCRIQSG